MADTAVKKLIWGLCNALIPELFAATETQQASTALAAFLLMTLV